MPEKPLRAVVVLVACAMPGTLALTQSRDALEARYGSSLDGAYKTPSGMRINPFFAPNGSLCLAQIEAGRTMKEVELDVVLEELAPASIRGKYIMGTFLNYTCIETTDKG